MSVIPFRKQSLLLTLVLLPLVTAGCMVVPYDGQQYPSRNTTIQFGGYIDIPNAPVKVYAQTWQNLNTCGYEVGNWGLLGQVYSSGSPIYDSQGVAWYKWNLFTTVPTQSWCFLPGPELGGSGYSTNITGSYRYHASQNGTKWRTLFTSDKNTPSCSGQQNNSGYQMVGNCTRKGSNSHAVQIWAE